jgi:hypothetical protein
VLKRVRVTIGTGNAGILYVLKAGVTSASIEHKAATAKATTDVAVGDGAVEVTGGTKARLEITGTLFDSNSDPISTPIMLYYAGVFVGENELSVPYFTPDGQPADPYGIGFIGCAFENLTMDVWAVTLASYVALKGGSGLADVAGTYEPSGTGTGNATVTAVASSASQVLTALDASTDAEALITFALAPGSDGSAAISAAGPVVLSR